MSKEYDPVNWVNGETPINETNLNKMESGIKNNSDRINAAEITLSEQTTKIDAVESTLSEHTSRISNTEVNVERISGDMVSAKTMLYEVAESASIIQTAIGDSITVNDSANRSFKGLKLFGKNKQNTSLGAQLFDASKLPTTSRGGTTVANNGDGSFTIMGYGTLSTAFNVEYILTHEETVALLKAGDIFCAANQTAPYVEVALMSGGNKLAEMSTRNGSTSMVITEDMLAVDDCALRYAFYNPPYNEVIGGTVKPMLYQKGDGTWEPYTSGKFSPNPDCPQDFNILGKNGSVKINANEASEISVQTPNGLPGISVQSGGNYTDDNGQQWMCDVIDYERGKYIQNVKIANAKDLTWGYSSTGFFYVSLTKCNLALCTHYLNIGIMTDIEALDKADKTMSTFKNLNGIRVMDTRYTNVNDFISSMGDMKILYALPNPIERDLTEAEMVDYTQVHTNYPDTTITNDADAGMEFKYVADTKLYIDNKFAELQNAVLSMGANI